MAKREWEQKDRDRLKKYLILAFGITWGCWILDALLVALAGMKATDALPQILFTAGGFGPFIAACRCLEGGYSRRKLFRFLWSGSGKNRWVLPVMIVLETAVFLIGSGGALAESIQAQAPGTGAVVVVALVVFLLAATIYGGLEEPGWRGTLMPLLMKKYPVFLAVLVTGCVWVLWHVPLWLIPGDSHQAIFFASFALEGIFLSFWLAGVYCATGSVVQCMVLHGATNTLMGLFQIEPTPSFVTGLVFITAFSALLILRYGPKEKDGTED